MSILQAREQELQKYELISEKLDDIIEKGLEEVRWIVHTNISGLPEKPKPNWLLKRLPQLLNFYYFFFSITNQPTSFYNQASSSSSEYLERAFKGYHHDLSIANLQKKQFKLTYCNDRFTLFFEIKENKKIENRKITFFEPKYTKKPKIDRELEIEVKELNFSYSHFKLLTKNEADEIFWSVIHRD